MDEIKKGQEISDLINVKEEFATWLFKNAPVSYKQYMGRNIQSVKERLNEIQSFFPNLDFYRTNEVRYLKLIELITNTLHIKNRATNPDFAKYDAFHSNGIPKAILGKNNYVKFLQERFSTKRPTNYWIFQGSPKIYNAVAAINNKAVSTWTVSSHRDKIKKGDKFILWLTGAQAGCYALGRVDSEVMMMKEEDAEMNYYVATTPQIENYRVKIAIEHNFTNSPILWEMIKDDEVFKDFKGGNQGTNFTATKEEYDSIKKLISKVNKLIINISWNSKDWKEESKDKSNHEWVKNGGIPFESWNFANDAEGNTDEHIFGYAKFTNQPKITGKSVFIFYSDKKIVGFYGNGKIVEKKLKDSTLNLRGDQQLSFVLENKIENIVEKGYLEDGKRIGQGGFNYLHKNETVLKILDEALALNPNQKNEIEKLKEWFMKQIQSIESSKSNQEINFPLNQILYGPPGTGKTYTLKNEYFSKYTLTENSISPEVFFEETVSNLTWWQVIALALLEIGTNRVNEILENRWVAKKAQLSESKNVRTTIWGTLQMHTIVESTTVNYTQRQTPFIFNKTTDKKWELHENELSEQVPELYDTLASVNNFKPSSDKEIKHYVFTTFHQSFSYEDFIEGIKPVMEEGKENVTYKIENGIFKELCLRAQNDPNNRYAIFIDEINRGNISQIFGELITLIEADKRIGAPNEIKVKLPYSKKEFGVPSNIDIYGTMNTADRSVEALDTALRRRFGFVELLPDSSVVEKIAFKDYLRKEIMEQINNRVEVLLDKNHTLGHAYFIKNDFEHSFKNEIIPLLQEYFYNDAGKLGLILGKGFVRAKELTSTTNSNIFADFETKNEIDIVKSYELIPFAAVDFKTAIATLLT